MLFYCVICKEKGKPKTQLPLDIEGFFISRVLLKDSVSGY